MYLSKVFELDFVRRLHGTESRFFEPCKGKLKITIFDAKLGKDYEQKLSLAESLFTGILVEGKFKGLDVAPMCGALILQEKDSLCELLCERDDVPVIFKMVDEPNTASILNLIVALFTEEIEYSESPVVIESISLNVDGEEVVMHWPEVQ